LRCAQRNPKLARDGGKRSIGRGVMAIAISFWTELRRRNNIRATALFYAVLIPAFESMRGSLPCSAAVLSQRRCSGSMRNPIPNDPYLARLGAQFE